MIRERTSAGLAAARAEGRIGGRRKKLEDVKRREIAEAVISGRKTAAQMARIFGVSPPTVSRISRRRARIAVVDRVQLHRDGALHMGVRPTQRRAEHALSGHGLARRPRAGVQREGC